MKKNNSSRDEIYGRKQQDTLGQTVHTNREIAKEVNITPVLGKIQENIRNWLQHKKRMPRSKHVADNRNYKLNINFKKIVNFLGLCCIVVA